MRRGFTLIEVLVVAAIIALLAAILLPSLHKAREQGKRALCLADLHQLGVATSMYLDGNRDRFWRYYVDVYAPRGRLWWFGFEPNGPGSGGNRPLDKSRGALARYLRSTDNGLQCPAFPYDDGFYFPKFAARSASLGFNVSLNNARRASHQSRSAGVFVFADGVHFDSNPGMNEGHYIQYASHPELGALTGYAHFRHNGRAQVLLMDAHAESQPPRGPVYSGQIAAGPAANLTDPAGGKSIYGN